MPAAESELMPGIVPARNAVRIEARAASHGVALFPDAVSARGSKHLRELIQEVKRGHRAVIVAGDGALYPSLAPGPSGLTKTSYVLTDHVRSIDKRRIRRTYGQVSAAELASIDQGLELFLGLNQTE